MKNRSLLRFAFGLVVVGLVAPAAAGPKEGGSNASVFHSPPMKIVLEKRALGDDVDLGVRILVEGRLRNRAVLRVHLPDGASIVTGHNHEVLPSAKPGSRLERHFVLRGVTGPVRITVDAVTRSAGFHSEATWPASPVAQPVAPDLQPIAPTQLNGIMVDRAILVTPKK